MTFSPEQIEAEIAKMLHDHLVVESLKGLSEVNTRVVLKLMAVDRLEAEARRAAQAVVGERWRQIQKDMEEGGG